MPAIFPPLRSTAAIRAFDAAVWFALFVLAVGSSPLWSTPLLLQLPMIFGALCGALAGGLASDRVHPLTLMRAALAVRIALLAAFCASPMPLNTAALAAAFALLGFLLGANNVLNSHLMQLSRRGWNSIAEHTACFALNLAAAFGAVITAMICVWLLPQDLLSLLLLIPLFAAVEGLFRIDRRALDPVVQADESALLALRHALKGIAGNRLRLLLLLARSALLVFAAAAVAALLCLPLFGNAHYSAESSAVALGIVLFGVLLGTLAVPGLCRGVVDIGPAPVAAVAGSAMLIALPFASPALAVPLLLAAGFGYGIAGVCAEAVLHLEARALRGADAALHFAAAVLSVLCGALLAWIGAQFLGAEQLIACSAGLLLLTTAVILTLEPEFALRAANWLITTLLYRIKIRGQENVPLHGGALLVANHVSYADPPLLLAAIPRRVRFMMLRELYNRSGLHYFAKTMRAIPLSPDDSPKQLVRSIQEAREALQNGELVCIFAEGALTRIGTMLRFGRGLEKIVRGVDVPIIPIHIDQLWGSLLSWRGGKVFRKLPRSFPYPVTIQIGSALPASTPSFKVRAAVESLAVAAFRLRPGSEMTLGRLLLRSMRRRPWVRACADSTGAKLSYLALQSSSLALCRLLLKRTRWEEMVGVLLPPSCAGVVANVALLFAGKAPVNLNYTLGGDALIKMRDRCGLRTVITSRKFIEKLGLVPSPDMIFMEDLRGEISAWHRVAALAAALLLPSQVIERALLGKQGAADDLATVIFSSGSSSEPKGVMLSHANLHSNVEATAEVFQLDRRDCVLGVLPFFHSFGFTVTLMLPLLESIRAVYHSNPLEAGVIGELCRNHRATILLGTPTFLGAYIRKCSKEDLASLRRVVAGAEKLKAELAAAFEAQFGVRPFEGYGATELSPVASFNLPDFVSPRFSQTGSKLGSVGHPLPGVAAKIVDTESGVELLPGEEGMLLIRGQNVMKGYLNDPERTAQVIQDGWYVTGDIARMDDDGFLFITDRLSRFSKIGGEMVPHIKIEEELQAAAGAEEQRFVVTAIPHDKKGEQLVVLYRGECDAEQLLHALKERGLPNLWIPKRDNFIPVAEFPVLGSGKLDLRALKMQAKQALGITE